MAFLCPVSARYVARHRFNSGARIPHHTSSQLEQASILTGLRRAFWLAGLSLVAVGLTFALLYWLEGRSVRWILESQSNGRIAREARNLVLDRKAAVKGYLLSRDQVSLAPEFTARAQLDMRLDSLLVLARGNASQLDRARAIRAAVKRWERGWLLPALASAGTAGFAAGSQDNVAGNELFDSVRAAFDSFLAAEARIYANRIRVYSLLSKFSLAAVVLELLVLIGVLAWLEQKSYRHARTTLEQNQELEAQAEDLQRQAAELEEQAVELEEQADNANRGSQALEEMNASLQATIERLEEAEAVAISAQSRHEEAQDLLDVVLRNSPVGVALHDSRLRFIKVNSALSAMTGTPAEAHLGKTVGEVGSEELAEAIEPLLERVLGTGEPVTNVPVSGIDPRDPMKERHFLFSFFPVRLPGNARGVGSVTLETTQYRQLEEQLLQAQKMEAVGRLAGGVAHDFNNMLTAIRSYGELILQDMTPDTQPHSDMTEVVKAAERATMLTKKLLAFSRQQVLRPSRIDLNEIIEGLRNMLVRVAGREIEFTYKLAPSLWPVTADPTEIERVITNLVLNSHDAMPEGGRLIIETSNVTIDDEYASTHADTRPGPYVMVAVTDTGSGMTKEVREKLFEPFFTTKEKGKGTGLGLPSVYGIVKQSGGFVWVYSEPGRGTTFKVYLPRAEQDAGETDGQSASHMRTPRTNRRIGAETILLVEDDDEVRQVALRILRQNGYRVLEASNGADALRVCESEKYPVDLVVTDIVMPGMGGSELAEKIREAQPDARILFTSGYTEDAAVRQSFLQAGEAFIEKPFTPATLTKKARAVLDSNGDEGGDGDIG